MCLREAPLRTFDFYCCRLPSSRAHVVIHTTGQPCFQYEMPPACFSLYLRSQFPLVSAGAERPLLPRLLTFSFSTAQRVVENNHAVMMPSAPFSTASGSLLPNFIYSSLLCVHAHRMCARRAWRLEVGLLNPLLQGIVSC